jgi:Toprim domain-containing protein
MTSALRTAVEISRELAARIAALAPDLLPGGRREGHEWRSGSLAGEAGSSLGVHLSGVKAGVWSDFATGDSGDALDLVRAARGVDMGEALAWAHGWLGIEKDEAEAPSRPAPVAKPSAEPDPDWWRRPWQSARPIAGTRAENYLVARGLHFDDPAGRVLRFAPRRARKNPDGQLEHHPALLCALSDARTGGQCGIINVYLRQDGGDRLRDAKGKTCTGRARGAVVMLSNFDEPTAGLILCEGVETGVAIFQSELRPIWACGGAGTLATFPILGGIEALTVAADADSAGQRAAMVLAERWREAGREVSIVAPPAGDWADHPT